MNDVLKFPSQADIEQEAATWVWRLDDGTLPPDQRAAFEKWLQRDPRHRQAFEELGGVWQALDDLAEAKRGERIATFVYQEQRLVAAARPRAQTVRRCAIAATVLLSVLGATSRLQHGEEGRTLATAVGQQYDALLADGSSVELNTDTLLETRFEPTHRIVHLRKGEAVFKVAHDPARPFIVQAGDMAVRAIGTEFNVRLREGHAVEVIVTEGRVEVEPWNLGKTASTPARAPATRELSAGQTLPAAPEARATVAGPQAIAKALAWREGAIVFDGEPLSDAIEELNRYTDRQVILGDDALREMRVGGRFRTGDVDGFLEALTKALPVTVQRVPGQPIRVLADPGRPGLQ